MTTIPLTHYPRYLFHNSPTYNTWARLFASDIHSQLYQRPGFEGQDIWFFGNHPIRWIRVVGVVISFEDLEKIRVVTVDDGSGELIELVSFKDPPGNPSKKPQMDFSGVALHSVIKAKGSLNEFRNVRQIMLRRIVVLKDTNQEVAAWKENTAFKKDVLMVPWVVSEKMLKKEKMRSGELVEEEKIGDSKRRKLKDKDKRVKEAEMEVAFPQETGRRKKYEREEKFEGRMLEGGGDNSKWDVQMEVEFPGDISIMPIRGGSYSPRRKIEDDASEQQELDQVVESVHLYMQPPETSSFRGRRRPPGSKYTPRQLSPTPSNISALLEIPEPPPPPPPPPDPPEFHITEAPFEFTPSPPPSPPPLACGSSSTYRGHRRPPNSRPSSAVPERINISPTRPAPSQISNPPDLPLSSNSFKPSTPSDPNFLGHRRTKHRIRAVPHTTPFRPPAFSPSLQFSEPPPPPPPPLPKIHYSPRTLKLQIISYIHTHSLQSVTIPHLRSIPNLESFAINVVNSISTATTSSKSSTVKTINDLFLQTLKILVSDGNLLPPPNPNLEIIDIDSAEFVVVGRHNLLPLITDAIKSAKRYRKPVGKSAAAENGAGKVVVRNIWLKARAQGSRWEGVTKGVVEDVVREVVEEMGEGWREGRGWWVWEGGGG